MQFFKSLIALMLVALLAVSVEGNKKNALQLRAAHHKKVEVAKKAAWGSWGRDHHDDHIEEEEEEEESDDDMGFDLFD